jgi:cell division protease FtsH
MIISLFLIFFFSIFFFYSINDLLNNCWELLYENLAYIFSIKTDLKNINQKELELDSLINNQFKRFYSKNSLKIINQILKVHQNFLSKNEDILKINTFLQKYEFFLNNLDKQIENILVKYFLLNKFKSTKINEIYEEDFESSEKSINNEIRDQSSNQDPNFSDFFSLSKGNIEVISDTGIRFTDIAGNDTAKKEIQQIIDFLKNPELFKKLGAEIPKGVLLGGPPGTGKTLFAKAIAGEAGRPFLKASGSEFVELLVGLGAARVRELFEKARSLQPCIIFIDEIDSVAKARASFRSVTPGNEERDQTLNQLLVEMDGFEPSTGIIVIGATNRTNVLDPAIKRPGRFDRQIMLNYPNLSAREAILKVHARNKKIAKSVSIIEIAQKTSGFSGADIENLLNESAILATRRKKKYITTEDINDSLEKIVDLGLSGVESSRMKLKLIRAFPEIVYSYIVNSFSDNLSIDRISLISRDKKKLKPSSKFLPSTVSQYKSKFSLLLQILNLLSKFSSEKVIFGETELTTDRSNDLNRITSTIQLLSSEYGMSNLRLLNLDPDFNSRQDLFISDETRNISDNYSLNLINSLLLLGTYYIKNLLLGEEKLVDELLRYEQLDRIYFKYLIEEYYSSISKKDLLMELRKSLIAKILIKLNVFKKTEKKPIFKEIERKAIL